MQIKDLPASSVLNADDVLAKDTNGIATEKITGANLAAAVKLLASLLGVSDVVNSLVSTSTTAPLAAAQGKALNEHIGVVQNGLTTIEINGNSTTHTGGAAIGDFVIVRNSTISGVTDGLYTAAQEIPANTAIDSTYLTAVDGGGLNAVKDKITAIDVTSQVTFLNTSSVSNFNNVTKFYKAGNVVTAFIALQNTVELSANSSTSIFSVPTALKPKQTGWIGFNAFLQNGGNGNMYSGHVYIACNNGTFYWRTAETIPANNSSVLVATLTWIV